MRRGSLVVLRLTALPTGWRSLVGRTLRWWTLAWIALGLAGALGYGWLRALAPVIAANGFAYLVPGLLVAGIAVGAGVLALRPAAANARVRRIELGLVLLGGLVFRANFLGVPPALSHDAYRYVWDAQLVAHGVSPWAHTVTDPALAALRDHVIWPAVNWRDAPTIYPPGAQALFWLVHLVAPLNIGALQAMMALCDVATAGLTLVLLRQLGLDARRVAIYWWNPIPVLEFSFNAHVDSAALALTLLAVLLALRARGAWGRFVGGAALGFAALVKIYPLLYVVALVRRRDWAFLGGIVVTLVLVPLPFLRLGLGTGGFLATYLSQRFVDEGLAFRAITTLVLSNRLQSAAQFLLLALSCGSIYWLRRQGRLSEVQALLAVMAVWLLLTPHLFPWYVGGVLPLLALELGFGVTARRACSLALWLFALAAPFTYVVFAPGINHGLFLLLYLVPIAVALAPHVRRLRAIWQGITTPREAAAYLTPGKES
jgi:hypothetical protein